MYIISVQKCTPLSTILFLNYVKAKLFFYVLGLGCIFYCCLYWESLNIFVFIFIEQKIIFEFMPSMYLWVEITKYLRTRYFTYFFVKNISKSISNKYFDYIGKLTCTAKKACLRKRSFKYLYNIANL